MRRLVVAAVAALLLVSCGQDSTPVSEAPSREESETGPESRFQLAHVWSTWRAEDEVGHGAVRIRLRKTEMGRLAMRTDLASPVDWDSAARIFHPRSPLESDIAARDGWTLMVDRRTRFSELIAACAAMQYRDSRWKRFLLLVEVRAENAPHQRIGSTLIPGEMGDGTWPRFKGSLWHITLSASPRGAIVGFDLDGDPMELVQPDSAESASDMARQWGSVADRLRRTPAHVDRHEASISVASPAVPIGFIVPLLDLFKSLGAEDITIMHGSDALRIMAPQD